MSNQQLEETLKEVIGDTMTHQSTESSETNQENKSGETDSGETPSKEFVGGIDISDIPEQDRPRIKELLSKKVQLVEKGAQEKFKEIARYKKERDELLSQGVSEDEAVNVLRQHITQKQNPQGQSKAETLRTLDKMIKESDFETGKSLTNLRQVILEETGASDIKKELDEIKKTLGIVNNERANNRVQSLNNSLNSLSDSYGKEFIDKYRDEIVKQGLAFPQADVKRLIFAVADPDDIEQATLTKANKKTQTQTQKKLASISSPNSGVSGTSERLDIGKTSLKDIFRSVLVK